MRFAPEVVAHVPLQCAGQIVAVREIKLLVEIDDGKQVLIACFIASQSLAHGRIQCRWRHGYHGGFLDLVDTVMANHADFASLSDQHNVIALQEANKADNAVARYALRQSAIALVAGANHGQDGRDLIPIINCPIFDDMQTRSTTCCLWMPMH